MSARSSWTWTFSASGTVIATFCTASGLNAAILARYFDCGHGGDPTVPSTRSNIGPGGASNRPALLNGSIHAGFCRLSKKCRRCKALEIRVFTLSTCLSVGLVQNLRAASNSSGSTTGGLRAPPRAMWAVGASPTGSLPSRMGNGMSGGAPAQTLLGR